jgi:hypothetical protein
MSAVATAKAVLWVVAGRIVAAGSTFESSTTGGYGKDRNKQKQNHDFVHGKLLRMDGNPQACRLTVQHVTREREATSQSAGNACETTPPNRL